MVKMTHFIDWPADLSTDTTNTNFTICLDGPKKYFSSLEEWAETGTIKNKPVILHYIKNNLSKLNNCNILYITNNKHLNNYLKAANSIRLLTFSSTPGNAHKGVIVNFFEVDNNLRFEINLNVANNLGFEINPRLLKLAKIVNNGEFN